MKYPTFKARLLSAALSAILALLSIAMVTDTAFARLQHQLIVTERAGDTDARHQDFRFASARALVRE